MCQALMYWLRNHKKDSLLTVFFILPCLIISILR
nr:MAG TPA: hypothetical protein [Caudoviricetes sp.]